MMKTALLLIFSIVLTGCASPPPFPGNPTVVVAGMTPDEAQSHFLSKCVANGGRVIDSSTYFVTCANPMDNSATSILYKALLTEKHASNPDVTYQIAWTNVRKGLKISANAWIEHQNAFGKTTRNTNIFGDADKFAFQKSMDDFKKSYESKAGLDSSVHTQSRPQAPSPHGGRYSEAQELARAWGCSLTLQVIETYSQREVYATHCGDGRDISIVCEDERCVIEF
jgi:hypothetical protein